MLGRYGSPEEVARQFVLMEQRNVEMASRLKAPPAHPAQPEPGAPGVRPPQAVGAPAQPSQVAPVHPAAPEDVSVQIEQQARRDAAQDAECARLADAYDANESKRTAILTFDKGGNPSGELVRVADEIGNLRANLDEGFRKRFGIPDPDEYQIDRWRLALDQLETKKLRLEMEHTSLTQRNEGLRSRWSERIDGLKQRYWASYETQAREAEQEQEIEQGSVQFVAGWQGHMAQLFKDHNIIDPDDQKEIGRLAVIEAKATVREHGAIPDAQLRQYLESIFEREAARLERYHSRKMSTYGSLKKQQATQPAPPASHAVAPVPPAEDPNLDWEEKAKARLRQERATL